MSGEMTPPPLEELLGSDLSDRCIRLDLGDALAVAGRYEEAQLARDLLLPGRVEDGKVVRASG